MYENPAVFSSEDLPPPRLAAQFLMPRIDFSDSGSVRRAERLVRDFCVCGFIVFNGDVEQVRETTRKLASLSELPLLFGCDVERGLGQRVSGATLFPFAMAQGAIDDEEVLRRQAVITAQEMKYCGLNLAFAPVLDVNTEPQNPIINVRAFSDDPAVVSKLGSAFAETLQKEGVLACAKHFPGHGATLEDSHARLPSVKRPLERLMETDLAPFREAIAERLHSVMPAHVRFPALDPLGLPATLSEPILCGLLREKLGFNGLIVSDSFRMDALGGEEREEENILAALGSGVDIVLDPRDPEGFLERRAEDSFFRDPARGESLSRIFYVKRLFATGMEKAPSPDFEKNAEDAREISRCSACVLRGGVLSGGEVSVFHFGTDETEELLGGLREGFSGGGVRIEKLSCWPETPQLHGDSSLVCVLSVAPAGWTENCVIPPEIIDCVNSFCSFSGEKILLTFGSPYPAAEFTFFDTVISLFDSSRAAGRTAAEVLTGDRFSTAGLPVKITL
ncbi:MAG: glycoside hydrolase family 3 protein [Candidatus Dadabacteria bacterium]|nr:glycoside hydrolase family 3 protein [Candidatus Dadabacteria bacterium]MYA48746.1 glycoside hydrolase family 3 protein [Candidatus Dadabacteria bacterium]MYG82353.1 glycoside hydrolase family 3 protein [Candidatus Dadabacteria bacterium]MYK49731.1 glycoside hydrolase family 3 protein [Candidatus Dadabacteria bacterium]